MPNLRTIWHFKPQNALHQRMVNPTIANFFAILLQYNSKAKIVLQQYSKKNNILFTFFSRNFSLLYLIISVLFSLFLLCFSICSLFSSDPNTIHPHPSPSLKLHMASLSSFIVDRRAGFGSVDGGFETVDLMIGGWIGWVDHWQLRWWLR